MKLDKFILLVAAAAALFAGCKKEDDPSINVGKYVAGVLNIKLPPYVKFGDEYTLHPVGVHHPEQTPDSEGKYRDTLGYYFVNPLTGKKDTTKFFGYPEVFHEGCTSKDYTFKISKDTLATFSLIAYAFAPEHYSNSCTATFTIVSDEGTLVGFPSYPDDGTVEIGGRTYPTTTISGKQWMRRNLTSGTAGQPFENSPAMDYIYGSYFTWDEARTACPEGWELPSADDWKSVYDLYGGKVASMLGDVSFNNRDNRLWTLWYQVGKITDESHLSILPCGYGMVSGSSFKFSDAGRRAAFWTPGESGDNGVYVDFYENRNSISIGTISKKDLLFQVRCKQK